MTGKEALPHHSAMLDNDSTAVHHKAGDVGQHVADQHLQGTMPDNTSNSGDSSELRDGVSSAGQHLLNGTHDHATNESQMHIEQPGGKADSAEHNSPETAAGTTVHKPYQSEADGLASVSKAEPRLSVPQEAPASSAAELMVSEGADKRSVTQQQMDESGHADAFAEIMKSIPDHIKNVRPDMPANTESQTPANDQSSVDRTDSDGAGSSHSSETEYHQHVEL